MKKSNSIYQHRLVCLGDSLTQGFQSGAIYRTDTNYPYFLARALGLKHFEQANFTAQSGMPLNLEMILKGIEDEFGSDISIDEIIGLSSHVLSTIKRIKHYWESETAQSEFYREREFEGHFHNQSVFSVCIQDALYLNDAICKAWMEVSKKEESLINLLPYNAFFRAMRKVLNSSNQVKSYKNTLFSNVEWFSENGGIENLIVYLGANHLVGSVTDLEIIEGNEEDLTKHPFERKATVYHPDLFRKQFTDLAKKVDALHVKHVYTATIPYFTESPILNRYIHPTTAEFVYTHLWVKEEDFDPDVHPFLSESDIRLIHSYITRYNQIIKEVASEFGWSVLEMDVLVTQLNPESKDDLALDVFPRACVRALQKNRKTAYLIKNDSDVVLNTKYLEVDEHTNRISNGGIFSLDGLHPTTFSHGLMASGFMNLMQKNGVKFKNSLDWDFIINNDTLLTEPPVLLKDMRTVLAFFSSDYSSMFSKLGSNLFREVTSIFGGRS